MNSRHDPPGHYTPRVPARFAGLGVAALILTGCSGDGPTGVSGVPGRVFSVARGHELDLRLQTIGPGSYETPAVSPAVLRFLGVNLVTPAVPAGTTQLFRFLAVRTGRAIITFRHSLQASPVLDTVDVH